jgi:hypothetical protein
LVLLAIVMFAGCVTEVSSSTGTVYRWDEGGADAALVESARADLGCPTEKIQLRRIGLYHSDPLRVADGCGARGIYLLDCSTQGVQTYTPDSLDATERHRPYACQFVLISRFKLAPEPRS